MKQTILIILFSLASFFSFLNTRNVSAETFYHVGQTDTCDRVHITVAENQVCPRLAFSNACANPPYRSQIDDYTFTITSRSNNGQQHQVAHQYSSHFCPAICGGCAQNSIYTNETITVPATGTRTMTMPRASPYGYACGNYQMDYGISAVDGNTACNYYGSTYLVGASAICEAGRVCTGPTIPPVTPTPGTYTITGNVYTDENDNSLKEATEPNYFGTTTVSSTRGTVTTNVFGNYTISNIPPGGTTVSYTSLPSGYSMTYPLNGPPPSFAVTVGPGCTTNGANSATCSGGNSSNLNSGISNLNPWWQTTCADVRNDNGIVNKLPLWRLSIETDSTCPASPGVAFIGDGWPDYGQGFVSSTNQLVGGFNYPEVFTGQSSALETAYSSLLSKAQNAAITPTSLSTVCTLSNCTLPASLPHGIYVANGDLTLNTFTFPANQQYVLLVNGTLNIRGNISVPVGSTALFAARRNIVVASNVGSAPSVTTPNLAGWYVAGESFILNATSSPPDLRLNVAGSIVANAEGTGGTLQNSRDLYANNGTYPTLSIVQRIDLILNAPTFLKKQQSVSRELAP